MLAGNRKMATIFENGYATAGFPAAMRAVARRRLKDFKQMRARGEFVPAIEYARAYLRLGQKEETLLWLAKACEERNRFALFINADPAYDVVRADPRFQALVKRIHTPN
jgi:hypothetical protein